jgi:nucleoside-diphosphate-sugar epimerase
MLPARNVSYPSRVQSANEAPTDILLGAGGSIAAALAPILLEQHHRVRLVSRRGHAMPGTEAIAADLLDADAVMKVIADGSTVFLVAGLRYHAATWEDQWPRIMRHAIDACAARGARLIFFDNVYTYGAVEGPMTERTPSRPISRKGEVRARIADALMNAAAAGRLQACIARAADFYGPHAANSVPHVLVFAPLARGQRPKWLVDPNVPHSFTYVPDCGRALATLAGADDAWGQVWHLPTAAPPLTGEQFVSMAARAIGVAADLQVLAPWMIRLAGLVDANARESQEMLYQYDRDYLFVSSKFERRFQLRPTPYEAGITETARHYRDTRTDVTSSARY